MSSLSNIAGVGDVVMQCKRVFSVILENTVCFCLRSYHQYTYPRVIQF